MNWTALRWTDLRDRFVTELDSHGYLLRVGFETERSSALGHAVSGFYPPHSQVVRTCISNRLGFHLLAGPIGKREGGPALTVLKDRALIPAGLVGDVTVLLGRVLLEGTVARLEQQGHAVHVDELSNRENMPPSAALDLPARTGAWCRREDAAPELSHQVEQAIRTAGFTPVPVTCEGGEFDVAGELNAHVRLGVGVARQVDGSAEVLYDDMKHLSRVLEVLMVGERK